MNRTLSSLAVLKVNWDHFRKDYIENFIPFIATLIIRKKYTNIDPYVICNDFKIEFGLDIPYQPMMTILKRARKNGLIDDNDGYFTPNTSKSAELDFAPKAELQLKNYTDVIESFIQFAKTFYSIVISEKEATDIIINFLRDHDMEILFISQKSSLLPMAMSSKSQKYIFYQFTIYAYKEKKLIFQYIADMSLGHIFANAIFYNDLSQTNISLLNVNFYFDTRFVLRLLGTEGEERETAYHDFINMLRSANAKLYMFDHSHTEALSILNGCLRWINNPQLDISKASPALKYFLRKNFNDTDVILFLSKFDKLLLENEIEVVYAPAPDEYKKFQIDEDKLKEVLVEIYKDTNQDFEEVEKEYTIVKDLKSVAAIHKLRQGDQPKSLEKTKYIFITTNAALALACRKFETSTTDTHSYIPTCVTDIFAGTLLWLGKPINAININEKRLLAECHASLCPDDKLLEKYVQEVEKLKENKYIDQNDYYFLKMHPIAQEMLAEKTMCDINKFTDKTIDEILQETKSKIRTEEKEKYIADSQKREEEIMRLEINKRETENIIASRDRMIKEQQNADNNMNNNIGNLANRIGTIISWIMFSMFFIIASLCYVFQLPPAKKFNLALSIIAIILTLLGIGTGFNLVRLRHKIQILIKNTVALILLKLIIYLKKDKL